MSIITINKFLLLVGGLTLIFYVTEVHFHKQLFIRWSIYPSHVQQTASYKYGPKGNGSFTGKRSEKRRNDTKIMLFWTPQHWFVDWVGNRWDTSHVFSKCHVSNCVITKEKEYMNTADTVLFRSWALQDGHKKRKQGQIWIIFEHEPPTRLKKIKYFHQNMFNWTMTYRRDSDFHFVHGQFSKVSSPYKERELDRMLMAKTKTAVAFISHCTIQSRRLEYIRKLRKYGVDVDIYGKCGTLKCNSGLNRSEELKAAWNVSPNLKMKKDCFNVLDSRYKFYLSFENSLCDDYVSEKSLHLVLRHNIVPIIRDASNHSLFHPPKSYLDTKDFKNVESLANHIKKLSRNFREYKKYFHWKKYYTVETVSAVLQSNLCQICERLHNQHKYQRVYRDIVGFLLSRGDNSPICHQPSDL